jgi:endonuclease/exonuclease/phosphatase (EEP) superfamily protein YafD
MVTNTHAPRKAAMILIRAAIGSAAIAWGAQGQPASSRPDLTVSVKANPNPVPPGKGFELQVVIANIEPPHHIVRIPPDTPSVDPSISIPIPPHSSDGETELGADVPHADLLLGSSAPTHHPSSVQTQPALDMDCHPTSIGESTMRCTVGPLEKGKSWTITFVYPNPGFSPTGYARIAGTIGYGATIDDQSKIDERDEGNNNGGVTVNFEQPKPPLLRLGSAGLGKQVQIDQDTVAPQESRAKSGDNFILLATAKDTETGIRRVGLVGENRLVCEPLDGSQLINLVDPVAETATAPSGTALPSELAKQFGLDVPTQRRRCPNGTRFYELRLELRAEAENGRSEIRQPPAAIVRSFGPNTVRVATFNLYEPGHHPDNVYVSWGQTLGTLADVLLLTEVPDHRRAQLVASAAGMPYVAMHEDVAIASRASLRNIHSLTFDPPGRMGTNNSHVLAAETDLGNFPHQFIVSHWAIRYNDVKLEGWQSSPSRLDAARAIFGLLAPPTEPTFVGGDFNAYSGIGPQHQPGSTAEIDLMRSRLGDAFVTLEPNATHCSDQRIDYVFWTGPYVPIRYDSCFPESLPSDHPIVVVTFGIE